ncbi:hypothetical protein J2X48_001415 [Bosea sp. BE271]|uniref:hypothetical protein n=1 Tax=Bosea TaxID=85413 RepID=UPI00285A9FED|nr:MULTISPECIES: hypothetical protein [Bosea]MDR6827689.1 hypothetical protein [Bosea robiniae]MDR6894617.1 hypothetical protein [Bosea sp. BE109]MDR7137795.1 hypothetical protein [Bosea sp. BE168]MDR7174494.1 hypothetical protein [Bosea sp. BE271]
MDGAAFKKALVSLGHTQSSFAREYRLPVRTVQNWAKDGPPDHMDLILSVLLRQKIEAPSSLQWSSSEAAMLDAARAFDVTLRTVLLRATKAGWPKDVAVAGFLAWSTMQVADKG